MADEIKKKLIITERTGVETKVSKKVIRSKVITQRKLKIKLKSYFKQLKTGRGPRISTNKDFYFMMRIKCTNTKMTRNGTRYILSS